MAHPRLVERSASTSSHVDRIRRAEGWHFWFRGRRALVGRLLARHAVSKEQRILDVGCGTGLLAERLRRRGFRVVGLDRVVGEHRGAPTIRADAVRLPINDGSVDVCLFLDVLEHVDDRAALAEARRVLRPGGLAILSVPAAPSVWSHRDRVAGHLRRYSRRGLVRVLSGAGFRVEEIRYYQFLLFPLFLVSRMVGRRWAGMTDLEERLPRLLNAVLAWITGLEVRMGDVVPWPCGSSLAVVCRRI